MKYICLLQYILLISFVAQAGPIDSSKFNVEYARSICEIDARDLIRKLSLSDYEEKKKRDVVYYDTDNKDFLKKQLIIRLRNTEKKGDLTVKIRPTNLDWIKPEHQRVNGFKCEWDQNRTRKILSCSYKKKMKFKEIKKILSGEQKITDSIRDSQWILAGLPSAANLPWNKLRPYGPAKTRRWENAIQGLDYSDNLESDIQIWELPNGKTIMEASFRTSPNQLKPMKEAFLSELTRRGVVFCHSEQGKTSQVIDADSSF